MPPILNRVYQFHALWALVNITVGNADETHAVVDAHAIPELVKLLSSTDPRICDQATWVLANIAGESPQLCDYVLEAGALPALVAYMGRSIGSSAIKAGVWALKNLCKDSLPLTLLHWMTVGILVLHFVMEGPALTSTLAVSYSPYTASNA